MKKTKIIGRPKARTLKTLWSEKSQGNKNIKSQHPIIKASYIWSILEDQLKDILGPEIHFQWFRQVRPVVISDKILILEVSNSMCAHWIYQNYQELIEILLSTIDKDLGVFFISRQDLAHAPKAILPSLKSATSEIDSDKENQKTKAKPSN